MNRHRQTPEVIALAVLFLSITVLTVVGFASREWLPAVASEHGRGVDGVIRYLLITTGAILVIGTAAMVAFLWRYARGKPAPPPHTTARAEYWWSLVPVFGMAIIAEVGVLLKGLPVWEQVYGEPPEDAVLVEATGKQFEWIIRYPGPDGVFGRIDPSLVDGQTNMAGLDLQDPASGDDLVFRNQLHVPVGRSINVQLRGRDVLHSFAVPALRVKQDVIPGIVGRTVFVPTVPGEYEIGCAELCGMGHYRMRGRLFVHTQAEFEEWLRTETGRGSS